MKQLLTITLPITILIVQASGQVGVQEGDLTPDDCCIQEYANDVEVCGEWIIVGARKDSTISQDRGSVYAFRRDGLEWTQAQKLLASDGGANDEFGSGVALSGTTAVIGASAETNSAGAAYVFELVGDTWVEQQKITPNAPGLGDLFGDFVSISGDTLVATSWRDNIIGSDDGSATVFVRNGGSWTQQARLRAGDPATDDFFGLAVDNDAETVIVGAPLKGAGQRGAAYVFVRTGNSWAQQAKLESSDGVAGDRFGRGVGITGDVAVVGAAGDAENGTRTGAAYVFERTGTIWSEVQKLVPSNAVSDDQAGYSVAIDGDTIVVGSYHFNSDQGEAWIFRKEGGTWVEKLELADRYGFGGDDFGIAVDICGDTVAVAALSDCCSLNGEVHPFRLIDPVGTSYCQPAAENSAGFTGKIVGSGSLAAADEDLTLTAYDLPPGNVLLFLASENQGFLPAPGTSCGFLCLMGPDIARFKFDATLIGGGGAAELQIDPWVVLTNPPQPLLAGSTWNFQAWFRDVGDGCDNNFTDAVEVTLQ